MDRRMSEHALVEQTATPATIASLRDDLVRLGVEPGMVLLCHSSLRRLGWVCGAEVSVVRALESALAEQGTLVMPTHSTDLSEPSFWQHPPVPAAWWPIIREQMPAFSPDLTPVRGMGRIAECFRKQDGVLRSGHPQQSFAAWGRHASTITNEHGLAMSLGESSPLRRIYDLDGWVLLLGVGHDSNTSLHLAEHRARLRDRRVQQQGAPLFVEGSRRWVTFEDLDADSDDFASLGADFARETGLVRVGRVGQAVSLLMPQRPLVDWAVGWLEAHRGRD
jgi:aminoglycoside 3-N-acetyltransferase